MIKLGRTFRRRSRALLVAAAIAGGSVAVVSPQPASAAGTTGSMTTSQCGWHQIQGPGGGYRITTAMFPWVSGLSSSNQEVELYVEFMHPVNGYWQDYRTGWYYTYAHSGAWSTSWSSAGVSGYTQVDDIPGESGYVNTVPAYTAVKVTAYWFSGTQIVGGSSEFETNPRSSQGTIYDCNSGANYA